MTLFLLLSFSQPSSPSVILEPMSNFYHLWHRGDELRDIPASDLVGKSLVPHQVPAWVAGISTWVCTAPTLTHSCPHAHSKSTQPTDQRICGPVPASIWVSPYAEAFAGLGREQRVVGAGASILLESKAVRDEQTSAYHRKVSGCYHNIRQKSVQPCIGFVPCGNTYLHHKILFHISRLGKDFFF